MRPRQGEAGLPTSAFIRWLPLFFRRLGRRIASHLGVGSAALAGHSATEILFHATETLANQERGLILIALADHGRGRREPARP